MIKQCKEFCQGWKKFLLYYADGDLRNKNTIPLTVLLNSGSSFGRGYQFKILKRNESEAVQLSS